MQCICNMQLEIADADAGMPSRQPEQQMRRLSSRLQTDLRILVVIAPPGDLDAQPRRHVPHALRIKHAAW